MSHKGVLLMNLGSPDSFRVKDVRKYLTEFLMDKRVIDYPYLLRLLLVRGIIIPRRVQRSSEAYKSIWQAEGSPLICLTKDLEKALAAKLNIPISIAMRYGHPSPKNGFDQLLNKHPHLKEVLLIPMYPHYAMSSFETAVLYAKKHYKKYRYPFRLKILKPYYKASDYINALAHSIAPYLKTDHHLLFSYHGVPKRHILKGDITKNYCLNHTDCCYQSSAEAHQYCYRHQCLSTTYLVAQKLGLSPSQYSNAFQSRLGKEEWLQPYTADELKKFPQRGAKNLLVVCPAFVSDCLETLEEIAEEGKHIFLNAGGKSFTLIPCLNTQPQWIKALAHWIENDQHNTYYM